MADQDPGRDRTIPIVATNAHDPRLTPARADLAAAHLRGTIAAERYVEGRRVQVAAPLLDLKRRPRFDSPLDTQLLHGETLQLYEEQEGWAWVQAERDGYVGYVATEGLRDTVHAPTHLVSVARTFVYPAPDMKQPVSGALPLAARVTAEPGDGAYVRLSNGGWVYRDHLASLDDRVCHDVVNYAERLLDTPYLWGGRSPEGVDCSGLVQLSFAMAGIELPRDTHMQQAVGDPVPSKAELTRGDLVFWRGHVGVMGDETVLIHANGYHMLVCREPLDDACGRIAAGPEGSPVVAMRRVPC